MRSLLRRTLTLCGLMLALFAFGGPALAASPVAVLTCLSNPCGGPEGSTLNFSGTSSTGTNLSYKWSFEVANEWTSISDTPSYVFLKPKTYTVTLRVIDQFGATNDASRQVVITNATPQAIAYVTDASETKRYDNAYLRRNDPYTFYADESSDAAGGIVRYEWDWDYDGIDFVAESGGTQPYIPDKRFDSTGSFLVALRVRDDDTGGCDNNSPGCAITVMHVQVIGSGAIPKFTPPAPGFLRGQAVKFTDTSVPVSAAEPITKWEWDFDYTPSMGFVPELVETSSSGPNRSPTHAFKKARDYRVALRVTDGRGSEVAYATVTPVDVAPQAVLIVEKRDANNQPIILQPTSTDPAPTYEMDEDEKIDLDASTTTYTIDPGSLFFRWDDQFDLYNFTSFNANGNLGTGPYLLNWPPDNPRRNDCENRTDPKGRLYGVALRALNDNSLYTQVHARIRIKDVPPNPTITLSNGIAGSGDTLSEGDLGSFEVKDWARNKDPIVHVKWIWNYGGNPADFDDASKVDLEGGAALSKTTHAYNETGLIYLAAEITDSDGYKAVKSIPITIIDKPALALISMKLVPCDQDGLWSDLSAGSTQRANEGSRVCFTARRSTPAGSDGFKQFLWDTEYDGTTFVDRADTAAACNRIKGKCTYADWITCDADSACPGGKGDQGFTFGDGPSQAPRCIALCVLDSDWLPTLPKNCAPGNRNFTQLCFNIDNVPPVFDPAVRTRTLEVDVDSGFVFEEPMFATDQGGANDKLEYSILPVLPGTHAPNLVSISPDTGAFTWIVDNNEIVCPGDVVDFYTVRIQAKDKDNGVATLELHLRANKKNAPPVATSTQTTFLWKAGEPSVASPLSVQDSDSRCGNERIDFYVLSVSPPASWLTFDGDLKGTPPATAINKSYVLTVRACDSIYFRDNSRSDHCTTNQTYTVQVVDPQYVATCSFDPLPEQLPGKLCVQASKVDYPGADKDALSYVWSIGETAEPIAFLENTRSVAPALPKICFMASAVGDYTLTLHCDSTTHQGPMASTKITVGNLKPTAFLPLARSYPLGQKITLDASLSSDGNNQDGISGYIWTDERSRLSSAVSEKPSFNGLNVGLYDFALSVVDKNLGSSETLPVTIEVLDLAEGKKALPFATFVAAPCDNSGCKASNPAKIGDKAQIMLDAGNARQRGESLLDPNYVWRYVSGPAASESDLKAGYYENRKYQYLFTPPAIGIYTFELIVRDGTNASRPFLLSVPVSEAGRILPVANAGSSQRVVLQGEAGGVAYAKVALNGRDSFAQAAETIRYAWTQVGGPKVTLFDDTATTQAPNSAVQNPSFYAFKPGLYAFSLTVNSKPSEAAEEKTLTSAPSVTYVAVAALGGSNPVPVINSNATANPDGSFLTDPDKPFTLTATQVLGGTAPYTYMYSQLEGPSAPVEDWDNKVLTFTPDLRGQRSTFRLIVVDAQGSPSLPVDTRMTVRVQNNAAPRCIIPVGKQGLSAHVGDTAILDGTGTDDPENQPLTYVWEMISGPEPLLPADRTKLVTSVVPLEVGTYVFRLKANDGIEDCDLVNHPAQVTLSVIANIPPVANAGPDQTICVGTEVQLDGSASKSELDHAIQSYLWAIKSGTAFNIGELRTKNIPKPVVTPASVGTVVLTLVVSDGFKGGESEPDEITLIIDPCNCLDKDHDNYWAKADGSSCGDSSKPWDCNDTDPNKNAGILGSCDCVDNDHDGCGTGPECSGPDANDNNPQCCDIKDCPGCIDYDGDKYGDGPDCLGPDCDDNDASVHNTCVAPPSGKSGCAQDPSTPQDQPLAWLILAICLAALALTRKRGVTDPFLLLT